MKKIFIMATILRCILEQQSSVGTILEIFDADPYMLISNIDRFLNKLADAIAATILLKTIMGDLSGIEIMVDIDHCDETPISYIIENPATSIGINEKALSAGLGRAQWHTLKSSIIIEARNVCKSKIRRDMVYYLVSQVLTSQS